MRTTITVNDRLIFLAVLWVVSLCALISSRSGASPTWQCLARNGASPSRSDARRPLISSSWEGAESMLGDYRRFMTNNIPLVRGKEWVHHAERMEKVNGVWFSSCGMQAVRAIYNHSGNDPEDVKSLFEKCHRMTGNIAGVNNWPAFGPNAVVFKGVGTSLMRCVQELSIVPFELVWEGAHPSVPYVTWVDGEVVAANYPNLIAGYTVLGEMGHATPWLDGVLAYRIESQSELDKREYQLAYEYESLGVQITGLIFLTPFADVFLRLTSLANISATEGMIAADPLTYLQSWVSFFQACLITAVYATSIYILLLIARAFITCLVWVCRSCYYWSYRKKPVRFYQVACEPRELPPLPPIPQKVVKGHDVDDMSIVSVLSSFEGLLAHHVSPETPCLPCQEGTCQVEYLTIIYPGVVLDKTAQLHLARKPNLILNPEKVRIHVDCVSDGDQLSTRPAISLASSTGCAKGVKYPVPRYYPFAVYSLLPTPEFTMVPKEYPAKVVDGSTFLFDDHLITMVYPTRDTMPKSVFTSTASRLCTDAVTPDRLYDECRTFLASQISANSLKVSHMVPWVLLLQDAVNRASMAVSPSISANLPMNATWTQRIQYAWRFYLGRRDGFSSQPSNVPYAFPDRRVPTYEVHAPRRHVNRQEPRVQERRNPFLVVRPVLDAPVGEGDQRVARPDGHEHNDVDGDQGDRAAANPEPNNHRVAARQEEGGDVVPQPAVRGNVPGPANRNVNPPRLGRVLDGQEARPDLVLANIVHGYDNSRRISSTNAAGTTLSLVPIANRRRCGTMVQEWRLFITRDGSTRPLSILACYACARRALLRYHEQNLGSAFNPLADRFKERWDRSGCDINSQGLPSDVACAQARERILREEAAAAVEAENAIPTNENRQVGQEVPDEEAGPAPRGVQQGNEEDWSDTESSDGEVFPEDGDFDHDDGPPKHLTQKRRVPFRPGARNFDGGAFVSPRRFLGKGVKPLRQRP